MKRTMIIPLVLMIIILTGCGSFGGSRSLPEPEVFTGFEGLVADFEPESPPDQIFEGDTVQMSFRLENKGATDIQHGVYTLIIDPTYVALTDDQQRTFSLEGKKIGDPRGGLTFVTTPLRALPLSAMTETMTINIGGLFCYRYATHASAEVCIDTDVSGRQQKQKTCSVGPVSLSGGQGGPVSVDEATVTMLSHPDNPDLVRPQFSLRIANVGDGLLVSPGSLREACGASGLTPEKLNIATVHAWLAEKSLTCSGESQMVRFKDRIATVRCTLDEGIPSVFGTYTGLLRVEVEYGYTTTVVKEMEIRKSGIVS